MSVIGELFFFLFFAQLSESPLEERCMNIFNGPQEQTKHFYYRKRSELTLADCNFLLPKLNKTPCKGDKNFSETDLIVEREIDWRGGILCVGKVQIRIEPDYNNLKGKIKVSLRRIPKYREDIFSLKDIYKLEPNGYDLENRIYDVDYYLDNSIIELKGTYIDKKYLEELNEKLVRTEIEEWPPTESESSFNEYPCRYFNKAKNDLFLLGVFSKVDGVIDDDYVDNIFDNEEKYGLLIIKPGRCYEDNEGFIYQLECVPFACFGFDTSPNPDFGDLRWYGCKGIITDDVISITSRRFGDIVVMHEVFENKPIRFKRMIDCTWLKPTKKQKYKK